ncbi:MAG: hypothetical protein ACPGJV_15860 [Bacteriovoracaceae bacterium]
MKLMMALIFVFSGSVFADQIQESNMSHEENFAPSSIRQDLRFIKRMILRGDDRAAIRRIDDLLQDGSGGDRVRTYTMSGIVYNTANANFRCSYTDQQRAKRIASDGAQRECYQKGHSRCVERTVSITRNGYIGSINGRYYGYGCVAKSVYHGSR